MPVARARTPEERKEKLLAIEDLKRILATSFNLSCLAVIVNILITSII